MEPFSDLVAEGKLISETSYPRHPKGFQQLQIGRIKIDLYDPRRRLVYEVKRAPRLVEAHKQQLRFYLYVLEKIGIQDVRGVLVYPQQRRRLIVELTDTEREKLEALLTEMERVRRSPTPPPLRRKPFCQRCAYHDFCWIQEPS